MTKTCEQCGQRATIVRLGLAQVDKDRNIIGCDLHWLCQSCRQKTAPAVSPTTGASRHPGSPHAGDPSGAEA
jgi:hypothetical protein